MKNDSVCKFFHDLRTANIHTESPRTYREVSVSLSDSIQVSDSIDVKVIHAGNVISESLLNETEIQNSNSINNNIGNSVSNNIVTIKMVFEDKPQEDGISLCESYLSKIEKIVGELSQIKV